MIFPTKHLWNNKCSSGQEKDDVFKFLLSEMFTDCQRREDLWQKGDREETGWSSGERKTATTKKLHLVTVWTLKHTLLEHTIETVLCQCWILVHFYCFRGKTSNNDIDLDLPHCHIVFHINEQFFWITNGQFFMYWRLGRIQVQLKTFIWETGR